MTTKDTKVEENDEQRESYSPSTKGLRAPKPPRKSQQGKLHLGGPNHGLKTPKKSTEGTKESQTVTYVPIEIEGKHYWGDNRLTKGEMRNKLLQARREQNDKSL